MLPHLFVFPVHTKKNERKNMKIDVKANFAEEMVAKHVLLDLVCV